MNDAAPGEKEEGDAERDARLVQQLQERTRQKINAGIKILLMRVVCECYLDDKKECGGRVEGPVVKSDDGGAMGAKQVPNL